MALEQDMGLQFCLYVSVDRPGLHTVLLLSHGSSLLLWGILSSIACGKVSL